MRRAPTRTDYVSSRRLTATGAAWASSLAGLALLAGGCGASSNPPAVADLAPTTSSSTLASKPSAPTGTSFVPFVTCMNAHGVGAATRPGGPRGSVTLGGSPSRLQAAQIACRKLLPGGGPPALSPAQLAERANGLAANARCKRKHGVPNFPDPDGEGEFPTGSLEQLDTGSTFFQAADRVCQPVFPKTGPQMRFG